MARETSTTIASGVFPAVYQILPPSQRGANSNAKGQMIGTNVVVINPENLVSVDAFATSGVNVDTTGREILGPHTNPLPRMREVVIENIGGNDAYISHKGADFDSTDAYKLVAKEAGALPHSVSIKVMHNVSIYAIADGATELNMLII